MGVIRNGNDKISILIVNIINSFSSVSEGEQSREGKERKAKREWRLVKSTPKHCHSSHGPTTLVFWRAARDKRGQVTIRPIH